MASSPLDVLRALINGDICTDEDCLGCGRVTIHSQEGDVDAAMAAVEKLVEAAKGIPTDYNLMAFAYLEEALEPFGTA